MLPVSETMLCWGQSIGGRWSIAALSVRPVPIAITIGSSRPEPARDLGGAGLAEPGGAAVAVGVGRHHLGAHEPVALGQRRGEIEAAGDRVLHPHPHQPLRHGERDEPLGDLARDAHRRGDLVLGLAGDVVEPAGPGGIVETSGRRARAGHLLLSQAFARSISKCAA